MTALIGVLKKVATYLLPLALDWAWKKVSAILEAMKVKKAIEDKNKAVREGLEGADTPAERDKSAEEIAGKF